MGCLLELVADILAFLIFVAICSVIGFIVKIITGIAILFWVTSIGLVVFGLIGAFIGGVFSFIGGLFRGDD